MEKNEASEEAKSNIPTKEQLAKKIRILDIKLKLLTLCMSVSTIIAATYLIAALLKIFYKIFAF